MTDIEVGTAIDSRDKAETAPVGTVIRSNGDDRLVRTYSGWVGSGAQEILPARLVHDGTYSVEMLDTMVLALGQPETLARYKHRFRTTVMGATIANGIQTRPVREALRALGCEHPSDVPPSPGMPIHIRDSDWLEYLPDNTLAFAGSPAVWDRFGMWVWGSGAWRWLAGGMNNTGTELIIAEVNGSTEMADWMTQTADETERTRIEDFMETAWETGSEVKDQLGLCGEFERAMERAGITLSWFSRPKNIEASAVANLPVGAVVSWVNPDDETQYAFWIRDDADTSEYKVRHLFGSVDDDTPNEGMNLSVAFKGRGDMQIIVPNIHIMDALPNGTAMRISGDTWHKTSGGWSLRPNQPSSMSQRYPSDTWAHLAGIQRLITHIGDGSPDFGQSMDAEEQAAMPEGTIFRWRDGDDWAWFIRDDESGNRARTVHLMGSSDTFQYSSTADFMGRGDFLIVDYRELEALPVGSTVSYRGRTRYTRGEHGGWHRDGRTESTPSRDFRTTIREGRLTLTSFGPPEDGGLGEAEEGRALEWNGLRAGMQPNREQMRSLPIGTRLRGCDTGMPYIITSTGADTPEGRSTTVTWGNLVTRNLIITDFPAPDCGLVVGQEITRLEWEQLPVGSTISGATTGRTWTRTTEGMRRDDGTNRPEGTRINGTVLTIGPSAPVEQPF